MLAYLDCFSGISGDMLLGALLDAGLSLAALRAGLAALPLSGYTLEAEEITDHGLHGTRASVRLEPAAPHEHRRLADIEAIISAASLSPAVREKSLAIFRHLATAEAAIHHTDVEAVTFHEVGAVDSIVDIVGAVLGLHLLGVERLHCSELPLTSGRVQSQHGTLPVPAPATLELLKHTNAVWRPVPVEGELVTPTGAAIVAALAQFERPSLMVRSVGYGFGRRALPWANCLRLVVGEAPAASALPEANTEFERDEVVILESNIDNMTAEALGWLLEHLLSAGALDVSYSPLQMKKNRPGTLLTIIASPADAARLGALVVRESGTLGVRLHRAERIKAERREERIDTPLGQVRVKLKLIGGRPVAVTPEYDDCRALAESAGLPIEAVLARITSASRAHFGLDG